MTSLLEKDAEFKWTDAQQAAFDELKKRLTVAPVDGLRCVLMQEGNVIAYASRQLRKHEAKYSTHDLELVEVNRICVPNVDNIRKLILSEAHDTTYSIHPSSTKMYYYMKKRFWWYGMKRAVAEYVAICDTNQRVKAEHQRPAGAKLAEVYISRIVCLHGVPKRIISDRGSQFTSRFWEQLHDALDTKHRFSLAYHPQTNGQTERTNQILEDMLRACTIQYGTSWDKCLLYAEFFYNNSYQASLRKSPFEALYGKRCRMPLFENQTGEKQDAEQQVQIVRENLRELSLGKGAILMFTGGIWLSKCMIRFNMKRKLAPRYIGPFKILEKKGKIAYRMELPPILSGVHDVFHVSQLKKCLRVPEEEAPLEGLERELLETRGSRCAVCSEVIIQRPRQHGNEGMS
ncbi:hypothetical protein U9M48_039654 [Paspalum notatum var. saurae]|uniref:Integrase catalytic domain-containing protein n=1 Tax=Paspalum notatum var. saurae TaxID=547442 RepID=A0AAQ3UJD2_PASNO